MGGGGKKRGQENLTNALLDPPPPRTGFPPPSSVVALFFLYKRPRLSRPEALLEGSRIFGRARSSVRFPPPIRFAPPPYHGPKYMNKILATYGQGCFNKREDRHFSAMWPIFGNGPNTVSGIRFQTPNSVSFSALTEFRGANSVSSFQPIICVPKRTHRVSRRTHRVCRRTQ